MKGKKVTIRGVDEGLYEEARLLSIKLRVSVGEITNKAYRLLLKKEKKA